MLFKIHRILHK